ELTVYAVRLRQRLFRLMVVRTFLPRRNTGKSHNTHSWSGRSATGTDGLRGSPAATAFPADGRADLFTPEKHRQVP
ncbi:hypothetical protein VS883_28370, partial [Escherichia coli]